VPYKLFSCFFLRENNLVKVLMPAYRSSAVLAKYKIEYFFPVVDQSNNHMIL
jgi:hypothetical protein